MKAEDIQMFKCFITFSDKGMQLHQVVCFPEQILHQWQLRHYHDRVQEITLEQYYEYKKHHFGEK